MCADQSVEYFLSALDFRSTLDNRIALWAITNTDTLSKTHPSLKLLSRVLTSETYGYPLVTGAVQPPGPTPLGTSLGEAEETLNANDDRMNQVVYENGLLWSRVNTVVGGTAAAAEDGFTGYVAFGGNGVARWGDYFAATADIDGSIWMAAEWIPGTPCTPLANWGTFVGRLSD